MSDPTISRAEAERQLTLDNRGQPSVSPRERRAIEDERIRRVADLDAENEALREKVRLLEIERDGLGLKLRGMPHDEAVAKVAELRALCRKLAAYAPVPVEVP